MSPEVATPEPVAEVAQPVGQAPEPEPLPVLSVKEHATVHSEQGRAKAADELAKETPEQRTARQEAAAQQKRDKDTGQFDKGKNRVRRESDKASPEDAPRIRELTGKWRGAEERAEKAERELAALRASGAPKAEIARAEAKVETTTAAATSSTFNEPEPQEDDPKYANDYGKYMRDVARWEGRKAYHDERASEHQRTEKAARDAADREAISTWAGRMDTARERYTDFEDVTAKPAPWLDKSGKPFRNGVTLDSWIMEHKAGPDVLYYFSLDKNREELGRLLARPVIEQVDHLALLSQRLRPESSEVTGGTRAVPGRTTTVTLPPKPPTLVRTEAQRSTGGPPPTDGTLGVKAHAKAFRQS